MSEAKPSDNPTDDQPFSVEVSIDAVMAVKTPERKLYEGEFVKLMPLDPDNDLRELYDCSHGGEAVTRLWAYMPYGPFADREDMHRWLEQCAASDDPLALTVFDKANERRVGIVNFMRINPPMRCLELGGIWYAPSAQRTKINTEAIYLMLCEAFDQLGYRRVEWKCNALNERSRKAALRLGFSFEGVFRQHMIVKGRNRDSAWFAMLDSEWPQIKPNMERWLYSEEPNLSLTDLNAKGNDVVVRRYFDEIINKKNLTLLSEFIADDYVYPGNEDMPGPDGLRPLLEAFFKAFPDAQTQIEDLIITGDKVVVRSITQGTHQGPLPPSNAPPTLNRVKYGGIDIFKVSKGKIEASWFVRDHLTLMQQLGMFPSNDSD